MRGVADNSKKTAPLPLLLTAALHLGALLLALVLPKLIPEQPRTPEVYQVELYTVPEALPPPPLPLPGIEAPSPPPAPPATLKPEATPSPVAAPPAPTSPVQSKAISLSPLKDRLARENREREDEARRRQRLEEIKLGLEEKQAQQQVREAARQARQAIAETYRSTPPPPAKDLPEQLATLRESLAAARGPAPQEPAPPTSAQLEAQAAYVAQLKEHLRRHWKLPPLQDWDEKLSATIVIRIKREGTVTATWFEKNSGNSRFDQYVKKAVTSAAPLPPLPREFTQNSEEIGVTFNPGGLK